MQNEKLKIAIKNSKLDIKERSYHFALKIIKLVESLPNRVCKINETKFWLGLLRDSGKKDRGIINPLLDETKQLSSILASSILKLKRKKF